MLSGTAGEYLQSGLTSVSLSRAGAAGQLAQTPGSAAGVSLPAVDPRLPLCQSAGTTRPGVTSHRRTLAPRPAAQAELAATTRPLATAGSTTLSCPAPAVRAPPAAGAPTPRRVSARWSSPPPATAATPSRPPANQTSPEPEARRQFGALQKSAPQLPVTVEVGGEKLTCHPGRPLNPEARAFQPCGPFLEVDDSIDLSPDILESLLADIDDHDDAAVDAAPPPPPCACHDLPKGSCPDFISRFLDLVTEVRDSGVPNMDGVRREIPPEDRQINPEVWGVLLANYFDRDELLAGLQFGWDFSLADSPLPADAEENLPSANQYPGHVDEYVATELAYGTLVGPIPTPAPWPVFRSPLGTVEKPRCPGKRRTITDCSQRGAGVNSWIRHDYHRGRVVQTRLPGTEHIVAAIKKTRLQYPGQKVKIFKSDYSRFYRQFITCPGLAPYFCVQWRGKLYFDRSWSFGNRGCCSSSQRYSRGVAWIYRTQVPPARGVQNSGLACRCPEECQCGDNLMENYIDDSLGVCPESRATWLFNAFIELVQALTLCLSSTPGHISAPATVCVVLGVVVDTDHNSISLPADKLADIRALLAVWCSKKSATPRELASLCGRLLWCARVVGPGRLFLSRVLRLKREADSRPGAMARRSISLDEEAQRDLQWWAGMVTVWNGVSFIEPRLTCDVSVDASSNGWEGGTPGLGCFFHATGEFIATGVPPGMREWRICDLELFCYVLCIRAWSHQWRGCTINILTDNEPTRMLLEGGRSRDRLRLAMAREIVGHQFVGDFRLHSTRIATRDNLCADSLSRLAEPGQWARFQSFVATHGVTPSRCQVQPQWFILAQPQ